MRRFVPILQWAPEYQRSWLRPDLIAGLTVAALVVPKALGYAGIAGVPLEFGLHAAAAGAILYALFATSRQIATGPSSALAAVAAGAVLGAGASGDEAITMVASITFVSGVLFLGLALLRMGWVSQFLSKALITGFLFGAGLQVAIGELKGLTGTEAEGSNSWQKLRDWLGGLEGVNFIDSQGSEKVGELLKLGQARGIELRLARVKPRVLEALRRNGVVERLGETALYGNLYEAAKDRIPHVA